MTKQRKRNDSLVYASRRRVALREAWGKTDGVAMLVTHGPDVGYLCGFGGEDSLLLLAQGWSCLLTDGRFSSQAAGQCPGVEIHVRSGSIFTAVADVLKGRRIRRIGVQEAHVTLLQRRLLGGAIGARRIRPIDEVIGRLRQVKDAAEIRLIRKAVRAAEDAFRWLISRGAAYVVGRSEREIAAVLDYRMRLAGASGPSFETIVASGANAALPHYRPGGRKIRRDEPVLIDWGAMVDGYASDLTRVIFPGRIPPSIAEVYEVVRRAQAAGIAAIRPAVSCKSVDSAARKLIDKAGYGGGFVHGLGHGIGREVHEAPSLSANARNRLRAGMVVTVEPGIYLPGVGGVRIEDDVLVVPGGRRKLSSLPTTIESMIL